MAILTTTDMYIAIKLKLQIVINNDDFEISV